jgi:hypothetical protein
MSVRCDDPDQPRGLPPCRLWLEDIEELHTALSQLGEVKVEVDGYATGSVDDLETLPSKPLRQIVLSTSGFPLVFVNLYQRSAGSIHSIGTLTAEATAAISDVRAIINQRRRPVAAMFVNPVWFRVTSAPAILLAGIIGVVPGRETFALLFVLAVLAINSCLYTWHRRHYNTMIPRFKKRTSSFWQRNKGGSGARKGY